MLSKSRTFAVYLPNVEETFELLFLTFPTSSLFYEGICLWWGGASFAVRDFRSERCCSLSHGAAVGKNRSVVSEFLARKFRTFASGFISYYLRDIEDFGHFIMSLRRSFHFIFILHTAAAPKCLSTVTSLHPSSIDATARQMEG